MAEFTYEGTDKTGQSISGRMEAATENDLRMLLRSRGIRPKKIDKSGQAGGGAGSRFMSTAFAARIPLPMLVLFTRQLQLLISSGIPLLQGLTILHEQSVHRVFKDLLGKISDKVSQGSFFWESLAAYPHIFPKLYIALIRAGETSGSLDQMLKRLTRYLEDSEKMRRMVKSAMMYPVIIISIGIGVISLMMIFVIPKFQELLSSSGQELPEITQMVINVSEFMIKHIILIVGGTVGSIFLLLNYLRTDEGKAMRDRILYRAPMFGPMLQKSGIARFSRTLQTLLMSGVNLIDAVDVCRATVDNVVIEDAVKKIRAEIESGKTIGMVVNKLDVFPKMAVQMISVGEATGNLDKMLEKIADYYESEVEILVGGLSKMIEPLVIVFLGGAVGFIMIAMYMPIFKLAGASG